jgi:hypothetical protein
MWIQRDSFTVCKKVHGIELQTNGSWDFEEEVSFLPPECGKMRLECHLSVSIYVRICASLAHERFDGFYSYRAFRNSSISGRCSLIAYIIVPIIGSLTDEPGKTNMPISLGYHLGYFSNFMNLWRHSSRIKTDQVISSDKWEITGIVNVQIFSIFYGTYYLAKRSS